MSFLDNPKSTSTVQVSVRDTAFYAYIATAPFMGPPIDGFDHFQCVVYAFLVTHTDTDGKQRKVGFDLGSPKDLVHDFPPANIASILRDSSLSLDSIEAIIWSHAHADHIGRPSLFPRSCTLVVGPGIKDSYFPGWPTVQNAPVLEREVAGREVRELDFSGSNMIIGGFRAIEYFGNGSFYLLDAPGRAIGHINALACTTPDTFVLCAGGTFHHASEMRPHTGARLPDSVKLNRGLYSSDKFRLLYPNTSGVEVPHYYVEALSHLHGGHHKVPFHTLSQQPSGACLSSDLGLTRENLRAVQKFDQDPSIFVVSAHNASLHNILEYYPKAINDWKKIDLKLKGQWKFLEDSVPAREQYKLAAMTREQK
ncbi:Cytochrome P450 monooxygenase mpaDE [Paramyrothecium foliicola]|nr:Cytochrome P450 monooxygenase mpaDE [Paramyrothecium foliicola]